MNYIDKDFTKLTNLLENLSEEEIFYNIKHNYLNLN